MTFYLKNDYHWTRISCWVFNRLLNKGSFCYCTSCWHYIWSRVGIIVLCFSDIRPMQTNIRSTHVALQLTWSLTGVNRVVSGTLPGNSGKMFSRLTFNAQTQSSRAKIGLLHSALTDSWVTSSGILPFALCHVLIRRDYPLFPNYFRWSFTK